MEDEFVISESKLSLLRQYQPHISALFSVNLEALPTAGNVSANGGSQVWIRVKSVDRELSAQQQQQQDVGYAKEYILSLVSGDDASWSDKVFYSREQFEVLESNHTQIEYNSRAVINLRKDEFSVQVHGLPMNIVLSQTYIEHLLQEYATSQTACSQPNETCLFPNVDTVGFKSRGEMASDRTNQPLPGPCLSPGADSCYGSSDDCLVDSSSFLCPPPPPARTNKVGITDPGSSSPPNGSSPPSSSQSGSASSSSPDPELDKNYLSRIEFGVKLGYSEAQVNSVLNKLGLDAPQNELLAELINLGTSKSAVSAQESEKTDSVTAAVDQPVLSGTKGMSFQPEIRLSSSTESDLSIRQSTGSASSEDTDTGYRHIVIDGSNVAMSHGNKEVFSCQGIQLAVDWFRNKGCKDITVFVPQWRKESSRPDAPIKDQHILTELEKERILSFTPARRIGGKRMVCYDDRYVLNLAAETDGIVVSNDNYRDLLAERGDFKKVVEERLLMYSFVRDMFMPPDDPLGRHGPSLENFLRKEPTEPEPIPPPCPYGKKCTYGNKCKYYHAERGNLPQISVTEKLAQQAKQQMLEVKARGKTADDQKRGGRKKRLLTRTDSSCAQSNEELAPPPRPPRKPITPGPPIKTLPPRDILETDAHENDAYNEKLSELRKNIPHDSSHRKVPVSEMGGYLEPGPWSSADLSKSRASPQLVTGHLDLAKTLSDEANREQRQKSLRQQQEELKQDLRRNPDMPFYTSQQDQADHLHRAVDQLSLHSGEAPRIQANRSPFSLESTHSEGYRSAYGDSAEFRQGQFFSEPHHLTSFPGALPEGQGNFGGNPSLSVGDWFVSDREGLTRTHSATPRGPAKMNRQNSTSDPVLNKHSVSTLPAYLPSKPNYGHYPNPVFNQNPSGHSSNFQSPPYIPGRFETGHYHPVSHPEFPGSYYPGSAQPPAIVRPGSGGMTSGGWPQQASPHIPENGFPPDTPILPTDTRYSLYYHFCGLFQERNVRHVMNRFPQETNPRTLCVHLLNLNG